MNRKTVAVLVLLGVVTAGSLVVAETKDPAKAAQDQRLDKLKEQNDKILKNQEEILKQLEEVKTQLGVLRRRLS